MNRIKTPHFLLILLALFPISGIFAQKEVGVRILFYQNDLTSLKNRAGDEAQGYHAGEWQNGVSFRRIFSAHFANRLELNFTQGRYRLSGYGPNYLLNGKRFSYLSFHILPELRATKTISLGAGGFILAQTKNPYEIEDPFGGGIMANLGFRYASFEVNCRFQRFFGSDKFTLGAGLDYFWRLKKKHRVKSE